MSNFFDEVAQDAKKVEQELLGPDYPYWKYIKTPPELGISSGGSISTLINDIEGIINYVELLVTGYGAASTTGRPLGTKFFLKTGGQCTDVLTNKLVDRYMYVNNIPDGSIPFLTRYAGMNFSALEGIVPGIISDLADINPMSFFKAFFQGAEPKCQEIVMPIVNQANIQGVEAQFVPLDEIANIPACDFPDRVNPVTNMPCIEAFQNPSSSRSMNFNHIYTFVISLLLLYLISKLLKKL